MGAVLENETGRNTDFKYYYVWNMIESIRYRIIKMRCIDGF